HDHHDVAGDFALDPGLADDADDVVVVHLSPGHVGIVRDRDDRSALADTHVMTPRRSSDLLPGGGGGGLHGAPGAARLRRRVRDDAETEGRRENGRQDAWQDAWLHRIPPWKFTRGAVLRAPAKTKALNRIDRTPPAAARNPAPRRSGAPTSRRVHRARTNGRTSARILAPKSASSRPNTARTCQDDTPRSTI